MVRCKALEYDARCVRPVQEADKKRQRTIEEGMARFAKLDRGAETAGAAPPAAVQAEIARVLVTSSAGVSLQAASGDEMSDFMAVRGVACIVALDIMQPVCVWLAGWRVLSLLLRVLLAPLVV